jgi:CRP-like cAMP-binding protein
MDINHSSRIREKASNRILRVISHSTQELNAFEQVSLHSGMVLQEPDREIDHVYFPEHGLVSLLCVNSDGGMIQVGVIGQEGVVGIPAILGGLSPYRAVVQIEGEAWRTSRLRITDEFERNQWLREALLKYTNSFMIQLAQSSICNCFHTLQERLSRWLLLARDASQNDRLQVTHDLLARLLGTRRASVTVTAGLLQRTGLIRLSRGEIVIVDSAGLESIACECYRIVREGVRRAQAQ